MLALLGPATSPSTERDAMWQAQWLAQAWAPLPVQREALVRAYEANGDASILIPLGLLEFQQGDPLRGRDLLEQVHAEGKADDTTLGYLINLLTVLPPRASVDPQEVAKQLLAELGKLDTVAARFGCIVFPIGMGLEPAVFSAEQTAAVVQLLEDAPHEAAVHGLALLTAALADDDSLAERIMAQPIRPRDARTGAADERAAQTLVRERAAVAVYRRIATGRDLDQTASDYLEAAAPQLGPRAALWRALAAARLKGSDAAHRTAARAELAAALAPHLGKDPFVDLWWLHAQVAETTDREVFRECLAMLPKFADRTAKAAAIVQLVHCMHRNSEVPQDDLDMLEAIARTDDVEWPIRVVANLLRAEVVGGDAGAALIAATRPLLNPSHDPAHTDSFDLRRDPLVWLREVDFFMAPFVGDDGIAHLRLDLSCTFSIEYAPVPVLAGAVTLYDN